MKKGETFYLNADWWLKNRAKTLKGDEALVKALKAFGAAAKEHSEGDDNAIFDELQRQLLIIGVETKKLAAKCGALQAETKECLGSAQKVVQDELKKIAVYQHKYDADLQRDIKAVEPLGPRAIKLRAELDKIEVARVAYLRALRGLDEDAAKKPGEEFEKLGKGWENLIKTYNSEWDSASTPFKRLRDHKTNKEVTPALLAGDKFFQTLVEARQWNDKYGDLPRQARKLWAEAFKAPGHKGF